MTLCQWLFHYMEIAKQKRIDTKPVLQKLNDIDVSLQSMYLLVSPEKGADLIKKVSELREKQLKNERIKPEKKEDSKPRNQEDEYEDLLSDEEKELWKFMEQQPAVMKETREMKNTGKFLLPTRSKQDLINQQYKVVDSAKEIKKPKMGIQ